MENVLVKYFTLVFHVKNKHGNLILQSSLQNYISDTDSFFQICISVDQKANTELPQVYLACKI